MKAGSGRGGAKSRGGAYKGKFDPPKGSDSSSSTPSHPSINDLYLGMFGGPKVNAIGNNKTGQLDLRGDWTKYGAHVRHIAPLITNYYPNSSPSAIRPTEHFSPWTGEFYDPTYVNIKKF